MSYKEGTLIKTYLLGENSKVEEVRRFIVSFPPSDKYFFLVNKITEHFPRLSGKEFTLYWKDEEGDKVTISSDEDLNLAEKFYNDSVNNFYVKIQSREDNRAFHEGVYCDECDVNISGIRYKCGLCDDYDLCNNCRESGIHEEHPMYRISHPLHFNRASGMGIFFGKHRSRGHSDGEKRRRRCSKRESGPETGDESEVAHHGKNFHKKCKKAYKCPYSQMMNGFLRYLNPDQIQPREFDSQNYTNGSNQNGADIPSATSYLRNIGSTLQKLLDPLGVNVEVEVRQKGEKKNEEETKKKEKKDEKQSAGSTPSAPPQKEANFGMNEKLREAMMEEITKILSNQTINNNTENDNGWVSFEELKTDAEPQPSSSAETPAPQEPQTQRKNQEKDEEVPQKQNLYPNLIPRVPSNPAVREALRNMLAMGFTNEGDWLTSLLEAKNGDINQALEALSFQKLRK